MPLAYLVALRLHRKSGTNAVELVSVPQLPQLIKSSWTFTTAHPFQLLSRPWQIQQNMFANECLRLLAAFICIFVNSQIFSSIISAVGWPAARTVGLHLR